MLPELQTADDLKGIYLGIAVVKYTISAAVLLINGAVVLTLVIQKLHFRPKTPLPPSGCFVVNLLVSDTLVGLILVQSQHFKIWPENAIQLAKNHYKCSFRFAIGFLAICASHNALLSVVIDRYLAIVHTMRYRELMTTRRGLQMIAVSWFVPLLGWTYLFFFGDWVPGLPACNEAFMMKNFSYVWLPLQIATLVSIVTIQVSVYLKIRDYGKNPCMSTFVLRRSTKKSARVMLISTIAFCLGYGPYDIAVTMYLFHPNIVTRLIYDLTSVGTCSTFLVNPSMYSFKTESIRKRLPQVFTDISKVFACCGPGSTRQNYSVARHGQSVSPISSDSILNSNRTSTGSSITLNTSIEGTYI